eukprot:gnl/TRDRNA2_/TRDRNA2_69829_c0_seq2.p2 gnl/TRDRNA2_/TRDRNA2_69829_c0~~gnl/TRDRNA2_/TRDRNA2_69829_c0_seq2.p2  ORF type:complete len:113 (+),score=5.95 gnl/TRDRNA2_/TRDRNA2_69829_c0_seq2:238-576(+)
MASKTRLKVNSRGWTGKFKADCTYTIDFGDGDDSPPPTFRNVDVNLHLDHGYPSVRVNMERMGDPKWWQSEWQIKWKGRTPNDGPNLDGILLTAGPFENPDKRATGHHLGPV